MPYLSFKLLKLLVMNSIGSDSSESLSIYETPITSPLNQSVVDSIRIDSSLFETTATLNSQSADLLDFRQSLDSIPNSVATEATLRNTVRRLNSGSIESNRRFSRTDGSVVESQQRDISFRNQSFDPNSNDMNALLIKYMSELESEQLELLGVEQQIQSLSLKCRTIRENMSSKTKAINFLISELLLQKKSQTVQKQTQTDFNSEFGSTQTKLTVSTPNQPLILMSSIEKTSEPIISTKTVRKENRFNDLSEDLKKRFNRLPALVKGYLTRRLMKTDKVRDEIQTIRDTTHLLSNYGSAPKKAITDEDIDFHRRLMIQLESSCHQLYDIFFNYSKSTQMALISRSRQHIMERHFRTFSVLSNSSYLNSSLSQSNHRLSSATKKVVQRKTLRNKANSSNTKTPIKPVTQTHSINVCPSGSPLVKMSTDRINSSTVRRSQRITTKSLQTNKRKANFDK